MHKKTFHLKAINGTLVLFIITITLGLAATALSAAQIRFTQQLTDALVHSSGLQASLLLLGMLTSTLILGKGIRPVQSFFQQNIGMKISFNLDRLLVTLVRPQTVTLIETPQFQNELNMVKFGFSSISTLYITITQVCIAVVSLVTYCIIIFHSIPYLPVLILLTMLPKFRHELKLAARRWSFTGKLNETEREKSNLQDILLKPTAMKELLLFHARPFLADKWDKAYRSIMNKSVIFRRSEMFRLLLLSLQMITGQTIVHVILVYETVSGSISLGSYVAILAAIGMIETSAQSIATYSGQVKQFVLTQQSCIDFLNRYSRIESQDVQQMPAPNQISLRELSFQYPNRDRLTLRDMTFNIRANDRIAIIGDNGSGKSTLAKIIAGLHQVPAGVLFYNDYDACDLDREMLFRHISMVSQDYVNYPLTVRECVTMEADPATERFAELQKTYSYLFAPEISADTVLGYDYRGARPLSGGQWQKLAIARALYKETPILILDEATASLDVKTEYTLLQDIMQNRRQQTLIAVTHRLHSCPLFTTIVVLKAGQIAEIGSHEELMLRKGQYYDMYTLQTNKEDVIHECISGAI